MAGNMMPLGMLLANKEVLMELDKMVKPVLEREYNNSRKRSKESVTLTRHEFHAFATLTTAAMTYLMGED